MQPSDALFLAVVVAYTGVCLVMDLRSRRIPNWLTVPALVLGLAAHTVMGGWSGLQFSLLGFATGFAVLFVLWLMGGGGGGDVKMMSALGAWLGAWLTTEVFVASAVVAMVIVSGGIVYTAVTSRGRKSAKTKGSGDRASTRSRPGRVLPYAVPLSLGTWAVLAYSWSAGGLLITLY